LVAALGSPAVGGPTRARMTLKLARSSLGAHVAQAETVQLLRQALDEPGLPVAEVGTLRANLGLLLAELGDASSGYEEMAGAVGSLRRRPGLAALLMGNLAMPGAAKGHEREHRRWLRRAIAQAERSGDPQIELITATVAVATSVWFGDTDAWEAVT